MPYEIIPIDRQKIVIDVCYVNTSSNTKKFELMNECRNITSNFIKIVIHLLILLHHNVYTHIFSVFFYSFLLQKEYKFLYFVLFRTHAVCIVRYRFFSPHSFSTEWSSHRGVIKRVTSNDKKKEELMEKNQKTYSNYRLNLGGHWHVKRPMTIQ